ncbi:MAG TPA: type II toxin-antitoxin system VapC family toxin, partial [Gemmatimonadota bacterium]|nr:type II toxin-antitoxin system VapC family toxin [Gemmatimonadota bacterium]
WMVAEPQRFSSEVAALLESVENDLLFSAASSWEIAINHALGRLPLPSAPSEYVPIQIEKSGVTPIAVEHAHALHVAELPPHHRDPFDRLLIAQAELEGATLLTDDRQFEPYGIPILWAR